MEKIIRAILGILFVVFLTAWFALPDMQENTFVSDFVGIGLALTSIGLLIFRLTMSNNHDQK